MFAQLQFLRDWWKITVAGDPISLPPYQVCMSAPSAPSCICRMRVVREHSKVPSLRTCPPLGCAPCASLPKSLSGPRRRQSRGSKITSSTVSGTTWPAHRSPCWSSVPSAPFSCSSLRVTRWIRVPVRRVGTGGSCCPVLGWVVPQARPHDRRVFYLFLRDVCLAGRAIIERMKGVIISPI